MADETSKPKLAVVAEELDEDEIEFKKLRRDLPGVKGASAIGIVTINVNKKPEDNEFFRTHPDFMPIIPIVNIEVGMERQFFAVTDDMVVALAGIGITVSNHRLYMIVTPRGAVRVIPINVTSENEYVRTKEIGLIDGIQKWVRLYTDRENKNYKVFPAPDGRYSDPIWPELKQAKIFRLVTLRLWRDQLGPTSPNRTDSRALFLSFVFNAEGVSRLSLGWQLPAKIIDLSTLFRCVVNGRIVPQGKGLLGALAYYGIPSVDAIYKDKIRQLIMRGWPSARENKPEILKYVMTDVDPLFDLFSRLMAEPEFDLSTALHWGEFVAVSAQMEHRGVPLDEVVTDLLDKRAWAYVRDAVVPKINAQYDVYVQDKAGEWHFNNEKFDALCARLGINWPRTESGKPNLEQKTLKSMCVAFPELEPLRQLRHARDKMRKIKLAVGSDGRNRTVLWPFQSKTSRTQPKASEWIFSPAVWLRFTFKPGPGRAVAYIDWSAMHFQIAGVLSHCQAMIDLYATGSPYVEFAKRFDMAPPTATKKTHPEIHDAYKTCLLGAQYTMQEVTLSQRLSISTFAAHEMLNQHRGLFRTYWAWSDDWIAYSLDTGVMRSPMGWTCRTGITEFNARSIGNWPIQAVEADIMRLACVLTNRRGVELIGCVHDALVIESSIEKIDEDVAITRECMRRASRIVLNSEHELRTDATIVKYPDGYTDKRGVEMWGEVIGLLEQYHQIQKQEEAATSA